MSAATALNEQLTQLAEAAEHGAAERVPAVLSSCLAACATAGAAKTPLADLQQRLTVWRDVWPRLGADPQFRAAVTREARRWSAEFLQKAQRG